MANEEHLAILWQGVEVWNEWRRTSPEEVDLSGADLSETDLRGANLSEINLNVADLIDADLRGANLRRAQLSAAWLMGANLKGVDLSGAYLDVADLSAADLREADLSGANLTRTKIEGAHLSGANLDRANLSYTIFANLDLRDVHGLETTHHDGPSTIGIDTIYKSRGKIPESFLRDCGVPDTLIEYLPSLLGAMQPIQFYSCFISHSSKDEEFAQRLYSRMRDHHLRVWFAPEDMKGGGKINDQIDQAIHVYDKLVLVLSEHSLRSKRVMAEVRKTRRAELATNRRKFFPIRLVDIDMIEDWECLDSDTGKDLAVEVREYFIPDFTRWKDHDSFERAFARLLKDLQATEAPPAPEPQSAPASHAQVVMNYGRGLDRLRALLKDHPPDVHVGFATLEARLMDYLDEERLHGASENTRAGKSQVTHSLNDFVTRNGLGVSFTDLCRQS